MATINQYPTLEVITGSELLPTFDSTNSDTRKMSISALSSYIASNISANISGYTTQYSAPSASGFSVNITDAQKNIHLILTPASAYAVGTIVLPLASNCADGQMVMVNCTQAITTFNITANGATSVIGAPSTISANQYFTIKFDKPTNNWYRVG